MDQHRTQEDQALLHHVAETEQHIDGVERRISCLREIVGPPGDTRWTAVAC
jgi:hypothetical protein